MSETKPSNPEPGAPVWYTVEALVELTGVAEQEILLYRERGWLRAAQESPGEPKFGDEAIYLVRRIEALRGEHGMSLEGIRLVFELMDEVSRLREEMRFLRP